MQTDKEKLKGFDVSLVEFDFEDIKTIKSALKGVDVLFLLRPPNIANVKKFFRPLINEARYANVKHIIFLSVQGVEKSKIIPHHKIEQLIIDSNIGYTFLRPAYFMQNFISTLRADLVNNKRIYLPAGKARFTLIDVDDIGSVVAKILAEPQNHLNKSYELTNNEILTFGEMAEKISKCLGETVKFVSPNLLQFYLTKRKENISVAFILVMIMLHYLPKFKKTPKTSQWVKVITGQAPRSFDDFVLLNKQILR